ncbi:MAG: hypothetical protein K1X71_13720 [Pirellulales bacterium]|nr:hypothetical protein [Pirellulales bacterium]
MKRAALLSLAIVFLVTTTAWSQGQPRPAAKPAPRPATPAASAPAKAPAKAPAAAKPAALSADEEAKKQAILGSERFHQARLAFEQWLTVQQIYTPAQIPALKARFRHEIAEMTANQLEQFLNQMEEKLNILMSPEAQDARNWLGHFVSAKVVLPPQEVKQWDILNMSPAQVEQQLQMIESRRGSMRSSSQAFSQMRQNEVAAGRQAIQNQQARSQQLRDQATSRMASAPAPSSYAPKLRQPPPRKGNSYYISPWGGVGVMLNP